MSIEVKVNIPAGEVAVERQMYLSFTDSGLEQLPELLRDACNAVLRSYDLPPTMQVGSAASQSLTRLKSTAPNLVESKRYGW